jgi:hypothetical protein
VPKFTVPAELESDLATVERGLLAVLDAKGEVLDTGARDAALSAYRNGILPSKLHLDIVAYRQPKAPNRNFIRFLPDILKELASSFVGQPFIRDHRQRDLDARGGTIIASEYQLGSDGPAFHQRVELNEPWAIGKALNGNLDRFSIGWHTTGDYLCSVCEKPLLEGDCYHWPGDTVDGKRVEAIVTGAQGVETSAVLVPAVHGTGVEAIRAALSMLDTRRVTPLRRPMPGIAYGDYPLAGRDVDVTISKLEVDDLDPDRFAAGIAEGVKRATQHKEIPMSTLPKFAALLGMPEDAHEESILLAVERQKGELARLAALLDAEKKAHEGVRAQLAELAAKAKEREGVERERTVARLLDACRLKVGQKLGDDKKPVRGGTPQERVLLQLAEHSLEEAEKFVGEMAQVIPTQLQSVALPSADEERARRSRANQTLDGQLGLSAEDFAKYGPRNHPAAGR